MARRGLVSKGIGQGPTAGGSALMPKGEKPKGPQLLQSAEVARRLGVQPAQVDNWIEKGLLRGDSKGIRPYDFKKFQLDNPEEIKRAKKESVQRKSPQGKRKPKKGFLSKFRSLFGGGGDSDGNLAKENKRLKTELQQLRKSNKGSSGKRPSQDLEEKVRYLEGKLSETRALESEVRSLKKQLATRPGPGPGGDHEALSQELEQVKAKLEQAQSSSHSQDQLRDALSQAQSEKEQLVAEVHELRGRVDSTPDSSAAAAEIGRLQEALQQRQQLLTSAEQHLQVLSTENEQLKQKPAEPAEDSALVDDLLQLQRLNLERFKKLRDLYQEALDKPQEENDSAELEELRQKYQALADKQSNNEETQEMLEQLSQARAMISRMKQENATLSSQLEGSSETDARIQELEAKLQDARSQGANRQQMESELKSLRKAMEAKENQIQKVASRLSDNEKRLAKAMGESARLTELLIERENRLRELSDEFEQEYRDKLENLDRQVSGLQWKLSLREERIAHLESELQKKGG